MADNYSSQVQFESTPSMFHASFISAREGETLLQACGRKDYKMSTKKTMYFMARYRTHRNNDTRFNRK